MRLREQLQIFICRRYGQSTGASCTLSFLELPDERISLETRFWEFTKQFAPNGPNFMKNPVGLGRSLLMKPIDCPSDDDEPDIGPMPFVIEAEGEAQIDIEHWRTQAFDASD
jgi:hypothetical protein